MRIDVLTLFPAMFAGPFAESIVARAGKAGIVEIAVHNLRDWTTDRHRTADDRPFGGGAGMVLKPEPLFKAIDALRTGPESTVILLTPQGELLRQPLVAELAAHQHLILICGHYEGVDERVIEHAVDREISIGDYVLSGGELPAMVLVDSVVRLQPGALGSAESAGDESHTTGLLEYPHYTRPAEFRGWRVPDVLVSGHHGEVERWRRQQALERTRRRRPDLLTPPAPDTEQGDPGIVRDDSSE
ncbi:MAG TPA: tRNA (guanosine(37)-N1)-methyltransferase TrmD [Chloroflexota bacterium]|nr:tRNA (guanosine(37)-N1)-methyltransferase TrmD [Chloroflexota bacterium]